MLFHQLPQHNRLSKVSLKNRNHCRENRMCLQSWPAVYSSLLLTGRYKEDEHHRLQMYVIFHQIIIKTANGLGFLDTCSSHYSAAARCSCFWSNCRASDINAFAFCQYMSQFTTFSIVCVCMCVCWFISITFLITCSPFRALHSVLNTLILTLTLYFWNQ